MTRKSNLLNSIGIILILLITIQISYSQNTEMDTSAAINLYQESFQGLEKNEFQYVDSFASSFLLSSSIFKRYNSWGRYLDAQVGLIKCYARKGMIDETKSIADEIFTVSRKHLDKPEKYYGEAWNNIGNAYFRESKDDSALVNYKKGVTSRLRFFGNKSTEVSNSYFNIGLVYEINNEYDLALENYLKSLNIRKEILGNDHLKTAQCYVRIGKVYKGKQDIDNSLEYFCNYIKIMEIIDIKNLSIIDILEQINCNQFIANIYREKELYELEITYLLKKIDLLGLINKESMDAANCLRDIGIAYYDNKQFNQAIEYTISASEIIIKHLGNSNEKLKNIYLNIGIFYNELEEYDLALEYIKKSTQIDIELNGNKSINLGHNYYNIGIIYSNKNNNDLAIEYYLKAVQIFEESLGDKSIDLANCYYNIGVIYSAKNEQSLSNQFMFKALNINKAIYGEKHLDVAFIYANMGTREFTLKSLEIKKEILGEMHPSLVPNYISLGNQYATMKEYNIALDYFVRALRIEQEHFGTRSFRSAEIALSMGTIDMERRRYDSAKALYLIALSIAKEQFGEKHFFIAKIYRQLGTLSLYNSPVSDGLKYYQKALVANVESFNDTIDLHSIPVINDYNDWFELYRALRLKGNLFSIEKLGALDVALAHYQACDTIISQVRQSASSLNDKLDVGEKASDLYERAISLCIKLSSNSESRRKNKYNELAFYFAEKNKAAVLLEALSGSEAQKFSEIPDSLLTKERKLKIKISQIEKSIAEIPTKEDEIVLKDKMFETNRQYDRLIAKFEHDYPKYFELKYNNQLADLIDIQRLLNRKTAILSYTVINRNIAIFTITKEKIDVNLISTNLLLPDSILNFRRGLIYPNSLRFSNFYKTYAYKMHEQFIPKDLDNNIKNLIIIPDAELSMIPFETLLTERSENTNWTNLPYLIKKYNISYSYSVNLFYKTFSEIQSNEIDRVNLNDWIAFAPIFSDKTTSGVTLRTRELLMQLDKELVDSIKTRGTLLNGLYVCPLPATEIEVKTIFQQFNNKSKKALVQINENANEKFVKSEQMSKFKIIHFATHGFVNTLKPELSGILMEQSSGNIEDGILYTGEIYNLKLNADLTVLSACETGLGKLKKGEGLIGLTRALLYAGSKSIIVSLWKVADKSTSDLMIDFYANLLEEKPESQDFSKALQQAKLEMIKKETYAHPFYWSPFILIGK